MTEKMFREAKADFATKLEVGFSHLVKPTREGLLLAFEDAIRDNVPVMTLPPASFPTALIHQDDYYGLDNEELSKKVVDANPLGCDGDV